MKPTLLQGWLGMSDTTHENRASALRLAMKLQLTPGSIPARFVHYKYTSEGETASYSYAKERQYRSWGAAMSVWMRRLREYTREGIDLDRAQVRELLQHMEESRRLCLRDSGYDLALDAYPELGDYIILCGNCGCPTEAEESNYSAAEDTYFGPCCEDSFVYSDIMSDCILADDAVEYWTSNPEYNSSAGYATERYLTRNGFVQSDYADDRWVDEDTHYDLRQDADDDDDSYPTSEVDGLHQYHCAPRSFIANIIDDTPSPAFIPLGVELEVYAEERSEAVFALRSSNWDDTYGKLILETDGSLDDRHGFEIVTNPLGRAEWKEAAPMLISALQGCATGGEDDPENSYGIHVNIGRKTLSPLQEARMLMFLCAEENGDFARLIAQRGKVYSAALDMGALAMENQKLCKLGGLGASHDYPQSRHYRKFVRGVGKYSPINIKPYVLEFRIFRSTLDLVEFQKNLEFVWALTNWTSPSTATGTQWNYKDFLLWLARDAKTSWDRYPNLLTYLHKEGRKGSALPSADRITTYLPKEKSTQRTTKSKAPTPEILAA